MSEGKTKILINDACIMFDLIELNLIDSFFLLGFEFCTSKYVLNEFKGAEQKSIIDKYIDSGKLLIDKNPEIGKTLFFFEKYPALSYTDCSILELSMRLQAILLTSDKSLRNIASKHSVQVRGLLGVIQQLFLDKIISCDEAVSKLKNYLEINVRAPHKETENMIKKLQTFNT
ncbi:MAG: hypothetical protein PHH30_05050 [Bacteroidales bacterium]|nr:hypothetical protein [Bacteroidales bacterium]MDD3859299.1 hypothetical protein [Bacteroidales bacterium]